MKDFDFDPQTSKASLTGSVSLPRDLADLRIWKKTPFDPAHALTDLFLLANTEYGSHTLSSRNVTVDYKPGWILWSFKGLAGRWGWSRDAVRDFMTSLESSEVVKFHEVSQYGKAIELLDFRTETTPVKSAKQHRDDTCSPQLESGDGDKEYGEGGNPAPNSGEVPGETEVLEFCRRWPGDISRAIPSGIPESWALAWLASHQQVRGDWRKSLELHWKSDVVSRHPRAMAAIDKKNGEKTGPTFTGTNGSRTPAQARFELSRELQQISAELDEAHELDRPANPQTQRRELELKKKLAELEPETAT